MPIKNIKINAESEIVEGYFLTIKELKKLVRDFQADCYDGFVSNDEGYIEQWLKNNSKKS